VREWQLLEGAAFWRDVVQGDVLVSVPKKKYYSLKTCEFKEIRSSKHRFKGPFFIAQWDHPLKIPKHLDHVISVYVGFGLVVTKKNGKCCDA